MSTQGKSAVYFANLRARGVRENKATKVRRLAEAAGIHRVAGTNDLAAVKLHFGEPGNDCFLSPVLARVVAEMLQERGAKPFFTDTNTLYAGSRHNAVDHAMAAVRHGYTVATVGAPVIIADGLRGENVVERPLEGGRRFTTVKLAGSIVAADAMVVLSHFKGHELAGFGGAIKNLAMGCCPGAGKREQHTPRFEVEAEKCIRCGECVAVCPVEAATFPDPESPAVIDKAVCIGCGECYAVCPERAVQLDMETELPPFMERMTEYALGAAQCLAGRVSYMNFLLNITPDCDCLPWSDAPIAPDIGILASMDPVALDQASLDLVNAQQGLATSRLECGLACGEHKFEGLRQGRYYGDIQLSYGEALGLGRREYELIAIDAEEDAAASAS